MSRSSTRIGGTTSAEGRNGDARTRTGGAKALLIAFALIEAFLIIAALLYRSMG